MLRPALALFALVLAVAGLAVAMPAGPAAAKAQRTCIVHRYTSSGKRIVFRTSVYRYKFVRRHGKRVRIIVKQRQALRGSCSKSLACVKIRVVTVGKVAIVYARKRVNVRVKRGDKLVNRRVTKLVPVRSWCVKPSRTSLELGVPVKMTILPPSAAHLDFGAFQRDAPIGGTLKGYSPEPKIDVKKDIPIVLTGAAITVGSAPIYLDTVCGGRESSALRTSPAGGAQLDDPTGESTSLLSATGTVTATTYLRVRLPLELRDGDDGCDKPYITTQYSEWPLRLFFGGKLDPKTGLTKLHLASAPVMASDLTLCMNPGLPTEPCSGFQLPLPISISTDVYVKVDLNARG